MTKWNIARAHVSAVELGTANPWIPERISVEAQYFTLENGFFHFKSSSHKDLYMIDASIVREIWDDSATVEGKI